MYDTSTLPFRPIDATSSIESKSVVRRASLLFAGFVVGLCVVAFMEPLEYAWYRPTYDENDDDERSEVGAREGSLQRQITLGTLGLFGAASLALTGDRRRFHGALPWICAAYLIWCAGSFLWSESVSMSLRRGIALGCEVLAGLAIAQRASPRQFAWLVFSCTLFWLMLGVTAEISQGALRPWVAGYRFKGVFHPNIMSVSCALLVMSSLYLSYRNDGSQLAKRLLQFIAVTALVFLVLTGSRTALGAVVFSIAIAWLFSATPPTPLAGTVGTLVVLAGVCIIAGFGALSVSDDWVAMGRVDSEVGTLTSRLPLWQELVDHYVTQHPLVGWGYGAFWTPAHIYDVAKTQGWNPSYAHSMYIDLMLSVGVIGLALFLAATIWGFLRATRFENLRPNAGFGFIAMVIACVLADGTLETTFGGTWFMSFFAICAICYVLTYDDESLAQSFATENS